MANSDYIPSSDHLFHIWQKNLVVIIEANLVLWGILPEDFAKLKSLQAIWNTAWDKASVKTTRTSADVQEKNDAKKNYKKYIRVFVAQWISHNTRVSNPDRERMGTPIYTDEKRTVPVPTTRPVVHINSSNPLQLVFDIFDETPGTKRGKPVGIVSCDVFIKIGGDPPADTDDCIFKGTVTRSKHVINFKGEDAGKIVFSLFRWVNSKGQTGPLSAISQNPITPL